MLTSYENHGKVEEIGHDTNQCQFPMKIKKAVEISQHVLEWQSPINSYLIWMCKMANIAPGGDTGLPCFGSFFGEYG